MTIPNIMSKLLNVKLMLPFLLAIRTAKDVSDQHVPVYNYGAQMNIFRMNPETNHKTKVFEMSSGLECHPRVPDSLHCRFDNTEIKFYQQDLLGLDGESVDSWDMSEDTFEIRFDRQGVSELFVDRSMPPWVIGALIAIIDQLNIGFIMEPRHIGIFETEERSYRGECQTLVTAKRKLDDRRDWSNDDYEITPVAGMPKSSGEILEILKVRDVNKCSGNTDPFYGRNGAYPFSIIFGYKNVSTTMTMSISRIVISDTNYFGFTANNIVVENPQTSRTMELVEEIEIKLNSINAPETSTQHVQQKSMAI